MPQPPLTRSPLVGDAFLYAHSQRANLFPYPCSAQVRVALTEGSHSTEEAVNKQLMDKERVLAALENPNLANLVDKCLLPTEKS